jgi:hypothetical protein
MPEHDTLTELESTIDEVTFAALAEEGEYRQLSVNGGRLEISSYEPAIARIFDLSDGHMAYLIKVHDWMINTDDGPYVFKSLDDF